MSEYKGFKYKKIGDGDWKIQYPGGFSFSRKLSDEAAVKKLIDEIIAHVV